MLELELDYDEDEIPEGEDQEGGSKRADDDEESGKEDQEELRNNLKNLDFNDNTEAEAKGDVKKRSVLANVSFSTAARGMKQQENRVKFKTDTDGSENDSGSASGSQRRASAGHKHNVPAPVQDPAFIGRRDSNFFDKVVPFIKGRRKKVRIDFLIS